MLFSLQLQDKFNNMKSCLKCHLDLFKISSYLENNAHAAVRKSFSRTTTLNSMIRTVTVEEDALKQTEMDAQDENSLLQSPHLIGNHNLCNRVSSTCLSGLYFK